MIDLLWLLLPAAAYSGWLAARSSARRQEAAHKDLDATYFKGLNYVLNEQPDKAIDLLIQIVEVDSETVETHLALGNLFRRRGEVDRAIRVHQNLIARPHLDPEQRALALLELSQDYLKAGLYDRAENLLQELLGTGRYAHRALESLLFIYEQERDWERCLETAERLEQRTGEARRTERAHYLCELAEKAWRNGEMERAGEFLDRAVVMDSSGARARILKAKIAVERGMLRTAVEQLQELGDRNPACLPSALPDLLRCYHSLEDPQGLRRYLQQVFEKHQGQAEMLALAEVIRQEEGLSAAQGFIAAYLERNQGLEALVRLIAWEEEGGVGQPGRTLELIKRHIDRMQEERPAYQCRQCGFSARVMHWQCPGCRGWSTLMPTRLPSIQRGTGRVAGP